MATPTELFINSELPKRPYTNQFPLTAGHVPVATGTGLQVEARALTTSDISGMNSYATQEDLSNVLAGLWDDRGAYTVNAAGNINYPSSAGSGVAGALMKGDIFTVAGAVAGVSTINNIAVNNGDTVRALVDNPSATDNAHWAIAENNIGYVPENRANKTTNTDLSGATGTYPDTPTVKSYIDNYDISAASISSTGTVTLTRTASNLTFQVPTAISGLSFDANTGVLTSSYTNNATSTTITVAANEVSDNVFRIKDNTDATKKIAFEATYVGSGTTKTIIMPNSDVDLGQMPIIVNITSNTTYSVSVANGTRDHIILTTSNFTLYAQNLTTSGSVIVRSKDGGSYTVTRSGSQAWNFVGASTNPITVSAGNDFYLGGNSGSGNHTCYMTGSFAAPSFAIRKDHTLNSPFFTFTAPNLTGTKTITMPNRDINLDGIPFVNNNSGSLGISNNQVNYLLIKQGDSGCGLPITYGVTGTDTIFIIKSNSISSGPILVNLTWSGQSAGFSLSPSVTYSDQTTMSPSIEYGLFVPLSITGTSGSKSFQIGNIAPSGSVMVGISSNGAGSLTFRVTYLDPNKIGANNTNFRIFKGLNNEGIYTGINAANLTAANTLTLADKNVDLGDLPSVATTNSNNLSGTRTYIIGGSGNTVSGTDNIAIGTKDFMLSSHNQVAIGAGYRSGNNIERVTCADTLIFGNEAGYALTVVHRLRALGGLGNGVFVVDTTNTPLNQTLTLTNTPKAVLKRSYFLNARHELTFTATVYSSVGVKAGTISGVRVFGVHYGVGSTTDDVGDYVVTSVTPYADLVNGNCSAVITASIVEVSGTKEKLLRVHIQAKNAAGSSDYLCDSTAELVSHYRLF